MGRGKHKPYSYRDKKSAYKGRKAKPNYPKGGYGEARSPYAGTKRKGFGN